MLPVPRAPRFSFAFTGCAFRARPQPLTLITIVMNQRILGCTSLKVSELCLGTMNFGWRTDESTSRAILDAYHAGGGHFIQAVGLAGAALSAQISPTYSETVVGSWWRSRDLLRTDLTLATRVNLREGSEPDSVDLDETVRTTCKESLRRLRTDYLDVLVCEWSGAGHPPEALRRGLDWLVREGLVRYVAFANLSSWRVVASIHEGVARNHSRIDALQGDYSLLARTSFEGDLAELCRERGLGFLARSPLAGGLLTRRSKGRGVLGGSRRAWLAQRYGRDTGDRVTRLLCELADGTGYSPAQIALSWALHHPGVTSLVVGLTSVEHLGDALKAAQLRLGADELRQLHQASSVQRLVLPKRATDAIHVLPSVGDSARRANVKTTSPLFL